VQAEWVGESIRLLNESSTFADCLISSIKRITWNF